MPAFIFGTTNSILKTDYKSFNNIEKLVDSIDLLDFNANNNKIMIKDLMVAGNMRSINIVSKVNE